MVIAAKKSRYHFNGVHLPGNAIDNYSITYEKLVVQLIKLIQELAQKDDDKDAKLIDLQKQIDELKTIILSGSTIRSNNLVTLANA